MKLLRKMVSLVSVLGILASPAVPAWAAEAEDALLPIERTANEAIFTRQAEQENPSITGRVLLPRTVAGQTGNPCPGFTANTTNVSFTITSAPNTSTYNCQLYQGTYPNGTLVTSYSTGDLETGVSVSDLTVGEAYYFVVSSLDAPAKGANATYTLVMF